MSARKPSRRNRPGAAEEVVYEETWADLGPGPIAMERNAFGEYHTPPVQAGGAGWADAVLSTGQRGLTWRVATDTSAGPDDPCVFEACQHMPRRPALLVLDAAGDLAEYTFAAGVRPLSSAGRCGLAFFAVLWGGDGRLRLVRNVHDAAAVLDAADLPFDVDGYRRLSVTVAGMKASVAVDGREVLAAEMEPFGTGELDAPRRAGRVALVAHAPARFAAPAVTCSPAAAKARRRRLSARRQELARLREANPACERVAECSLADFGAGRSLRIADVDGDGRAELLMAQHSLRGDEGNFAQISCLTAFRPDGEVLWQLGRPVRPTSPADAPTWDLPFQAADVDGDGRCELVLCRDWRIEVRDAATGELLRDAPTPRSVPGLTAIDWCREDVYDRVGVDAVHLADLSGRGRPGEFLIKDRYSNLWAYDASELRELWHVSLSTGHCPLAFDLDGDGREEVLCGYSLIDPDGRVIWQKRFGDHVDGIGVGHFDPDREDYQVALVAGDAGFFILSQGGEVLARHDTGHAQKMSIGNFLPERAGVEIAVITYWASQGILSVYDGRGTKLHESEPWHVASALTPVGWRGDGADLMLLSADPTRGGLLDGLGRRVVVFPPGGPHLACDAADLDGDGREEIIAWDFQRLAIYKAAGEPPGDVPPRYTGPVYNRGNYKAGLALPPEVAGREPRDGPPWTTRRST